MQAVKCLREPLVVAQPPEPRPTEGLASNTLRRGSNTNPRLSSGSPMTRSLIPQAEAASPVDPSST